MLKENVRELDKLALGRRIQDARIKKGIKALDMAVELNISKDQYSRIENGRSVCSTVKLHQIAQHLDVSVDYLLFGNEEKGLIAQICLMLSSKNVKELEQVKRVLEVI